MPILSNHFKKQSSTTDETRGILGVGGRFTIIETSDPHSLREWWYTILRNYGKYPCYAIFLALSSDKEILQYLQETRTELHMISGSSCLIILLGNNFFLTIGLKNNNLLPDDLMVNAVADHVTSGESVQVAELFGIELTQFPCIVFFSDIRSTEFALVSLKDLEASEVNQLLREVFATIRQQAKDDPKCIIEAIQRYAIQQKVTQKRQRVIQVASTIVGRTIEAVIDAWVKTVIK